MLILRNKRVSHTTLRPLAGSRKTVPTSTLLRANVFCLQSRHNKETAGPASAVVAATKREKEKKKKILWVQERRGKAEIRSAVLLRKEAAAKE